MRYIDNQPTKECTDCMNNYCKKCECDLTESLVKYFYLFWGTLYLLLVTGIWFCCYYISSERQWKNHTHPSSLYMGETKDGKRVAVTWYFSCEDYRTLQWVESHMPSRFAVTNIIDQESIEKKLDPSISVEWNIE